jgi:uncharacterized protein (TIGR03435 family)
MSYTIKIVSVATALLCFTIAHAQSFRPQFEVASVKVNKSVNPGGAHNNLGQRGEQVSITQFSLRMLMGQAYGLPTLSDAFDRIVGMPNWGDWEFFDIEAKVLGDTETSQKRLMLQSLLADRFKLALHRESQQRPVFVLITTKTGKLGPQLLRHTDKVCEVVLQSANTAGQSARQSPSALAASELRRYPCERVVGGLLPGDPSQVWSGGRSVSMEMIATALGGMEQFDRPILDRTGLAGHFDFTVEWNTQLQNLQINPPAGTSGVSLTTAIQEQLGLKLESAKGPVEVLVIDSVSKPPEN